MFYQAGVAVVSSSVFHQSSDGGILKGDGTSNNVSMSGPSGIDEKFDAVLTGSTVSTLANNLRTRLYNLQFNNTIELNSSIYYCRVHNNDFNYSSNPTYLSGSKIRVKTQTTDVPVTYITTVGLYSNSNELLAVAKLSEPLKKTPDNEFTIRVRLDY